MCAGLRKYSTEFINPSPKRVTQRIMTDKLCEIETASIVLRTCYTEDPGVLLTDFSCAFASVDHRSIVMVLERADVPLPFAECSP